MLPSIENLIGPYHSFFSDLFHRMKRSGIRITGLPISHLTYRTTTLTEYYELRDAIKYHCGEFVETQFNGRAVSILIVKTPLQLEDGFSVSMIELAAPREVHTYPSGLESFGVVVGKNLTQFNKEHEKLLTGVKDHGKYCQPSFITFDNDKTAKFYDISLREIIQLQGWQIERLLQTQCALS